jgi:hypothetical protein
MNRSRPSSRHPVIPSSHSRHPVIPSSYSRGATTLRGDEGLARTSPSVRYDEKHGLLPQAAGDRLGDALGSLEDASAASGDGRGHDLHHETILPRSLPDPARLEVRGAGERLADEPLDPRAKRTRVERGGKAAVGSRAEARGYPRADVEAHDASRGSVPSRPRSRDSRDETRAARAASVADHERRVSARRPGVLGLVIERDAETGNVSVETSWLPDLPEVRKALGPTFRRTKRGIYRAVLSAREAGDRLRLVRLATKAIDIMLEEEGL